MRKSENKSNRKHCNGKTGSVKKAGVKDRDYVRIRNGFYNFNPNYARYRRIIFCDIDFERRNLKTFEGKPCWNYYAHKSERNKKCDCGEVRLLKIIDGFVCCFKCCENVFPEKCIYKGSGPITPAVSVNIPPVKNQLVNPREDFFPKVVKPPPKTPKARKRVTKTIPHTPNYASRDIPPTGYDVQPNMKKVVSELKEKNKARKEIDFTGIPGMNHVQAPPPPHRSGKTINNNPASGRTGRISVLADPKIVEDSGRGGLVRIVCKGDFCDSRILKLTLSDSFGTRCEPKILRAEFKFCFSLSELIIYVDLPHGKLSDGVISVIIILSDPSLGNRIEGLNLFRLESTISSTSPHSPMKKKRKFQEKSFPVRDKIECIYEFAHPSIRSDFSFFEIFFNSKDPSKLKSSYLSGPCYLFLDDVKVHNFSMYPQTEYFRMNMIRKTERDIELKRNMENSAFVITFEISTIHVEKRKSFEVSLRIGNFVDRGTHFFKSDNLLLSVTSTTVESDDYFDLTPYSTEELSIILDPDRFQDVDEFADELTEAFEKFEEGEEGYHNLNVKSEK